MIRRPRNYWFALSALVLIAFLCCAFPLYVIRPFRAQGPNELALALVVRRFGPFAASVCAIFSIVVAVGLWRTSGLRGRALAVLAATATCALAVLSHVNVYERMFHPAGNPSFTAANSAHVDADDMVIAVRLNGDSRAYPIRTMGYHHIVNDRVGGIPIVVTY